MHEPSRYRLDCRVATDNAGRSPGLILVRQAPPREHPLITTSTTSPSSAAAIAWFRWFVGFLSGLIRPEKLGLDPTFQVIALYLHPVPLTLRNFEAFAFGDYPKNTSIRRGCRPDVHAGTLHKRDILVLARGNGLTMGCRRLRS
jgi:hypothetical protein